MSDKNIRTNAFGQQADSRHIVCQISGTDIGCHGTKELREGSRIRRELYPFIIIRPFADAPDIEPELLIGLRLLSIGVRITEQLADGLAGARVLIDFTRPEATMQHLTACRQQGVALVIGTTGFSEAQKAEIAAAAQHIPIVLSPNMSVGVNVTFKLLEKIGRAHV